jgi:hypothetical protein
MKKEKIVEKVCDAIKTGDIALEVSELIDEFEDGRCPTYIEQKEDVFLIEESGSEERELYDEDEFIDWVVDVIYCIYDDDGGHIGDPFDIGFHDQICELLEIKNK